MRNHKLNEHQTGTGLVFGHTSSKAIIVRLHADYCPDTPARYGLGSEQKEPRLLLPEDNAAALTLADFNNVDIALH